MKGSLTMLLLVAVVAAWISYSTTQARSILEDPTGLWQPGNGFNGTRGDWYKWHGAASYDEWEDTKRLVMQLKMMAVEGHPEYDISSISMNMTNKQQDRLDDCIFLTKEHVYELVKNEQEKFFNGYDRPDPPMNWTEQAVGRQKRKVTTSAFLLWDSFPIKWKFDGMHNDWEKTEIRTAFQHWTDRTCIRFEEVPTNQDVDDNHVLITKDGAGCYSYVGKIAAKPQQLNLQDGCVRVFGTIVHEIGHTLGLWHEQQRSDRDETITVLWDNLGSYVGQFYKYRTENYVPYDVGSVMHYGPQSGSKNGKNTMETRNPEYQPNMGQRTGLSYLDAKIINFAYCNATCPTPLPQSCLRNGYQDPNHCDRCRCPDGFAGNRCQDVEPSINATCGGEIHVTDSPITITSPGYNTSAKHYTNFQMCSWLVKAPAGHKLRLTFEDEFGVYCHNQEQCHHWIEVRHSTDLGMQGPRFCCYRRPTAPVESVTDEMMLVFKSSWTVPWASATRGFKARVVAVRDGVVLTQPSTTTATTTTTPTTTTTSPTTTPKPCATMDLAFAVDASVSIEDEHWSRLTDFISRFVAKLDIGQDCVRVSAVTFGDDPSMHFDLRAHTASPSLRNAIETLDRRSQSTNIAGGIALVRSEVFQTSKGDRLNAPNVCILITDGNSGVNEQNAKNEAASAKAAGISMFTIGIGNMIDSSELTAIADGSDHVIIIDDFIALSGDTVLQRLLSSMPIFPKTMTTTRITTQGPTTAQPTTRKTTQIPTTTTTTTTRKPTTTTTTTTTTTAATPASQYEWKCSFENADNKGTMCGMTQSSADNFDWTLRTGTTPSGETGPNSAHGGSGYYIFIEASNPRRLNDKAIIMLPSSGRAGAHCVSFYYSMNGFHVNQLRVAKRASSGQLTTVWTKSGDQGNNWFKADVTVHLGPSEQLAFVGVRGNEYSGDIAIDTISVSSGTCN